MICRVKMEGMRKITRRDGSKFEPEFLAYSNDLERSRNEKNSANWSV